MAGVGFRAAHRRRHVYATVIVIGAVSVYAATGAPGAVAEQLAVASPSAPASDASASAMSFATASFTAPSALGHPHIAATYANSFLRHLAARNAEVRAGARSLSGRTDLTEHRLATAPLDRASAAMAKRLPAGLGVFMASEGTFDIQDVDVFAGDERMKELDMLTATGSATVGADYRLSERAAFGFASTYTRFEMRDASFTPLQNASIGAAAYATVHDDNWYVDGYYGFSHQQYEIARVIGAEDAMRTLARGEPTGSQSFAEIKAGLTFDIARGVKAGPYAKAGHRRLMLDGYSERGDGRYGIHVDRRKLADMRVENGFEFTVDRVNADDRRLAVYGRFGFVRRFGDDQDAMSTTFPGLSAQALLFAQTLDREWYSAGAGVSYQLTPTLTARIETSSDFNRDGLDLHNTTAGLAVQF